MIALDAFARAVDGRWIAPGTGLVVGAGIDTRSLGPGQAFFALPGTRVDGHDFLDAAKRCGASVAVVERAVPVPDGLAVLRVSSVRDALWCAAEHYRAHLPGRVVAVMGSNGKTTTVRMLASILGRSNAVHASARSFNNALGLPLTILNCPPTAEVMVCELGEGEPGALPRYVRLAQPDLALVTSVGRAHVGELGGLEAVRREFEQALRDLPEAGCAIAPADLGWSGAPWSGVCEARHEQDRCVFELSDGSFWRLPVAGLHNAQNAAMAIAAARMLGLPDGLIADGLACFEPADMRLAIRRFAGATVIVDCYNANPDSTQAALTTLEDLGTGRRKVAVLGDMLELGPDAERWHEEIGLRASTVADECVFIGALSRSAHRSVGGAWFESIDHAREHVRSMLRPGTVLLLKGSRGLALEGLLPADQDSVPRSMVV